MINSRNWERKYYLANQWSLGCGPGIDLSPRQGRLNCDASSACLHTKKVSSKRLKNFFYNILKGHEDITYEAKSKGRSRTHHLKTPLVLKTNKQPNTYSSWWWGRCRSRAAAAPLAPHGQEASAARRRSVHHPREEKLVCSCPGVWSWAKSRESWEILWRFEELNSRNEWTWKSGK